MLHKFRNPPIPPFELSTLDTVYYPPFNVQNWCISSWLLGKYHATPHCPLPLSFTFEILLMTSPKYDACPVLQGLLAANVTRTSLNRLASNICMTVYLRPWDGKHDGETKTGIRSANVSTVLYLFPNIYSLAINNNNSPLWWLSNSTPNWYVSSEYFAHRKWSSRNAAWAPWTRLSRALASPGSLERLRFERYIPSEGHPRCWQLLPVCGFQFIVTNTWGLQPIGHPLHSRWSLCGKAPCTVGSSWNGVWVWCLRTPSAALFSASASPTWLHMLNQSMKAGTQSMQHEER